MDTEPFPINISYFDNKKVLVRPSAIDKSKDKEVIIDNTREADENIKVSYRKVIAEKILDGGETLKITIMTSNVGGRHGKAARCGPLFYAPQTVQRADVEGPRHRWTVRAGQADNLVVPKNNDNHVPSNPMTRNRYVEGEYF